MATYQKPEIESELDMGGLSLTQDAIYVSFIIQMRYFGTIN